MDAVQVQKKLELSPDEDFILTVWQYRMMQRDIAASNGKYLPSKREVRNAFRDRAVAAIMQRKQEDWSPAVAEAVNQILAEDESPNLEALESVGPEIFSVVVRKVTSSASAHRLVRLRAVGGGQVGQGCSR
ncbi:hypothetical protein [Nocardia sp. NPDC127526]|uniref:hypothetical protein n=1 Tax=Nocardia sp. NPDC127526 TaxID=3345393 RepID=UPI00363BC140